LNQYEGYIYMYPLGYDLGQARNRPIIDAMHIDPYQKYKKSEVMGLKTGSLATFFCTFYLYSMTVSKVMMDIKRAPYGFN
jgi:hypothetical protein